MGDVARPRSTEGTGSASTGLIDPSRRRLLAAILPPFLSAKVLSLAVPVLFIWSRSDSPRFPSAQELHDAFLSWDSQHYVQIALYGYPARLDFLDAFLPGYPILVKAATLVLFDPVVGGLFVSAVGELFALYYLARLVAHERDLDDARFSAWMLAFWPLAFFLTAIYTESVFIAFAAASLYYSRRREIAVASAAAFFATSIRITGVTLMLPLVIEEVLTSRWRPRFQTLAILLTPLPLALYALYMRVHTGDALAFLHAQQLPAFSHSPDWPWRGFGATANVFRGSNAASLTWVFGLEVLFGVAGLVVCVAAWLWRAFPRSFAAYCSAVWLLSTSLTFWRSVPRYEMAMFPALIILADLTKRRPAWRAGLITTSSGFMALGAAIFAKGWWLG